MDLSNDDLKQQHIWLAQFCRSYFTDPSKNYNVVERKELAKTLIRLKIMLKIRVSLGFLLRGFLKQLKNIKQNERRRPFELKKKRTWTYSKCR
jgi:hypothetical protein